MKYQNHDEEHAEKVNEIIPYAIQEADDLAHNARHSLKWLKTYHRAMNRIAHKRGLRVL